MSINVAFQRKNGQIGKVLKLGDHCIHPARTTIWNAIGALERFSHNATETTITTQVAFRTLGFS